MNPIGPSGATPMPSIGLIQRPGQHIITGGRVINVGTGANLNSSATPPQQGARRSTGSKLMRLRCRFRPLHDQYIKNGAIIEDDTDVIFVCGDGHQLKAHKVIMASSSKFFAKIFEDQTGRTAVVTVPDIKVDTMKLILQLTYRDRVYLTMPQIKEVGEFITIFGMAWTQFGYEEYTGEEPMSATPQAPVPMKPVELPNKVVHVSPSKPSQGQQRIMSPGPGRSPMQQSTTVNGNDADENLNAQQAQDRRKSRLTPRPGTEGEEIVEQDEEEDPENRIKDWMSKLGKREPGSLQNDVKRPRLDDQNEQPASANVCSVCNTRFVTNIAWRWHEERHVGTNMFKCKFCDDLSKTPKACYIHEKEVHGFSGLQQANSAQQLQAASSAGASTASSRPATLVFRSNQSGKFVAVGHQNFKRIKLQTYKKFQPSAKKRPGNPNFSNKHPQIGIGESKGSELIDMKKIKQLHWLYVCQRCENCSDSAQKAVNHYNRCYPDKETEFEHTVMKYRQGFYGKNKCPLCPRRYPQNTGFMIHCGHQHQNYRRLFTHTGAQDDQIKCINCKEAFPEPISFNEHLDETADGAMYCPEEPKEEPFLENAVEKEKPVKAATAATATTSKPSRPPRPRRVESPIEHKAQYKVQFHTPPKSARLANRVQAEAQAEASKKAAEAEKEKAKPTTVATDINFPPVDCPVCGDSDLPNISAHLHSKHKDLNVDVTRISSELLRCKGCTITFDICDLLDHKNCLLNSQSQESSSTPSEDTVAEPSTSSSSRRTSTSSTPTTPAAKAPKAAPVVVDMDSLPPGVGRSPIEKIEIEDLHSIEAIRTALKCGVCGKEALKLGYIADCLRSHGVHRCSLCFNSYCSKTDYATHLRKCHGAGSTKLKCPLCPKAFANAGQTSGHMYSTHWLKILKENENSMKGKKAGKATDEAKEKDSPSKSNESNVEDEEEDGNRLVIDEGGNDEKKSSSAKKQNEDDEDVEIE